MKFTNGQWLLRNGVALSGAVEVCDMRIERDKLTLFVASKHIIDRGQTCGGPLLTVEFTSPHKDVIGVRTYHYLGTVDCLPRFVLAIENKDIDVEQLDNSITVNSGGMTVIITKYPFSIEYLYNGKQLTVSDTKQLAYIIDNGDAYIKDALKLSVGECIYGLGERFGHFVKNGQSVDIWNDDGGTSSELSYKNIPFYVSNRGYGIFVNHTGRVSFEIGSEIMSKVQFSVLGEELEYFVIGGEDLKKVVSNYTVMTGRPALPPVWSFGLWLSTSFVTDYNEETVMHFVDKMFENKIPLSVFHFDCFWMKAFEWCNFEWDTTQFPDIRGMLSRLHDKGLKVCVWINPYIGQKSKLFNEGKTEGYFLKNSKGGVYQVDLWQPGMAFVDFTNPAAVKWFQGHLRNLLNMGVDCFKTDFGEKIPEDAVYYDGSNAINAHNYYSFLYNCAVFDLLEEVKCPNNAVLFARSATVGGQQFPVHWGGDCYATFESMAESLRGGLSLVLGGFGFWSHDIGGFENMPSADIYKRWVAFGLLSTHSRLHGSGTYRVPWLYDEEATDVLRFFTKLKHKLMPYIFAQAVIAAKTGIPVVRPMVLEYPDEAACMYLDKQYFLGSSILVAPIFNKDGESETYLPEGKFTHLLTGETVCGGHYVKEKYDYFGLPLYAKPNSIIIMGKSGGSIAYDYSENIEVHIYQVTGRAEAIVYDFQQNEKAKLTVINKDNGLVLSVVGMLSNTEVIIHSDVVTVMHFAKLTGVIYAELSDTK